MSVTLPVKPPVGVTVMVEAFPLVAPARTVTAVPVTVKLGDATVVTVTEAEAELELKLESPPYDTFKMSSPTASDPAGILIEAVPLLSVVDADE